MDFIKRFKVGLNIGLQSFGLLQKHKKLIFYLGAPVILGITFELIVYNLFSYSPSSAAMFAKGIMVRFWESFGWTKHLGLFLTQLIKLFVIIFFSVALTNHIRQITKHRQDITIKQSINFAFTKLRMIIIWALASTIFFVLFNQIDTFMNTAPGTPCYLLALIVNLFARTAWSISTIFLVPIITLQQLNLYKSIVHSIEVTKKCFVEYLGAIAWILIIALLGFAPFLLIQFEGQLFQTVMYALLALLGCVLSTAHSILKTDLYLKYK